jgi:hypothetical protein
LSGVANPSEKFSVENSIESLGPWRAKVIDFTHVMIVDRASLETEKLFVVRDFTLYLSLRWVSVGTMEALVELVHKRAQQFEHRREGILEK